MRLMDDIAMNLNKAEVLLCRIPADPQELNATVAEIKKLVHPAIKTTTRLMIQAEAHRLVESDPAILKELEDTLAAASRVLTQADTLLQRLPQKC